jgi:cytochrome b subunit of formate dehydrogenase
MHATHAAASVLLIATGLLMQFPDLRARLIGGYGLQIARIHDWLGAAFIAAPLLALGLAARPLLRDLGRRLGPPDPIGWRKIHIVLSLFVTLLLSLSGALLWLGGLPLAVEDATVEVHSALTWVLAASIPIHLFAARRKIAAATAALLRLRRPDEPPFPFEGEEEP